MATSCLTSACACVVMVVVVVVACLAQTVVRAEDPVLTTTKGLVQGSMVEGVKRFVGIPFAKPPLGDLRFKHPVEAEPWSGTKEAKTLPNSCWQSMDTNFERFHGVEMWNPNTPRSEDCLYLNVWIPDKATSNTKPILVWIYGGGFWAGTSTLDVYNPTKLVEMHDVIVVSMNYRLGTLGFLHSGTSEAPGNAGMMDQVMALQWVQKNAANMGGNPDLVTIMGESAGAASVGYHLLSDLSKPLYKYAVMMSASPFAGWGIQPHDVSLDSFRRLAGKVYCNRDTDDAMVECMRVKVNASTLTDTQWALTDGTYMGSVFSPITGDTFLPQSIQDLTKQVKDTSIMTGVVKDEGIYWLVYGFQDVFKLQDSNPLTDQQYDTVLRGIMAQQKHRGNAVRDFSSFIYRDMYAPKHRPEALDVLDDMSGDTLFKCAVRDFASTYSATTTTDKTFVYSFNYRLSNNPWPEYLGVAHGYEIENFMGLPFLHPANYSDTDRVVSKMTMDYLVNFINTGNPNTGSNSVGVQWPKFTSTEENYLALDETPTTDSGLRYKECAHWADMVPQLETLEKAAEGQNSACTPGPIVALLVLLCAALIWNGSVLSC